MRSGLLLAIWLVAVQTPAVQLAWDRNPDPTTVGYRVYSGGASVTYTNAVDAGPTLSALIPTTPGGTYFFAVTAYNAAGLESDLSAELRYAAPMPLTVFVERGRTATGSWSVATSFTVTNSQAAEFFRLRIE